MPAGLRALGMHVNWLVSLGQRTTPAGQIWLRALGARIPKVSLSFTQVTSDCLSLGLPWLSVLSCFSDSLGVPARPCQYLVLDEQFCIDEESLEHAWPPGCGGPRKEPRLPKGAGSGSDKSLGMIQGMDVALLGDRRLHPAVAEECNWVWCSVGLTSPQIGCMALILKLAGWGFPLGQGQTRSVTVKRGFSRSVNVKREFSRALPHRAWL